MDAKIKELHDYYEAHPDEWVERTAEDAWYCGYHLGFYGNPSNDNFSSNPRIQNEYECGWEMGWSDRRFEMFWDFGEIDGDDS